MSTPTVENPRVIKACICGKWQLDYTFEDVASYIEGQMQGRPSYSLDAYEQIIDEALHEHFNKCQGKVR